MTGKTERIYLGLGSNLGDRKKNLVRAVRFLDDTRGLEVLKISSLYETSAVGPAQRDFLNAVVLASTNIAPLALLIILKGIEKKLGRKGGSRWGPREIDMDILFYGRRRVRGNGLRVPHPRFSERRFVLVPMSEIASGFKPPGYSRTVGRLSRELTVTGQKVRLFGKL